MEPFELSADIPVFYVQADSFPAGIMSAHEQLHKSLSRDENRRYFGISRPEPPAGTIIYRAAAEELNPGEAEAFGFTKMIIEKGHYISITIYNYMQDTSAIGTAFQQLIAQPGIAADGYCVEWYVSDREVKCMVRLAN